MRRIGYPWSALDRADLLSIAAKTKHTMRAVRRALSDDPGHRTKVTSEVRRAAADILSTSLASMKIRLAHAKRLEKLHEAEEKRRLERAPTPN